LSLLTAVGGLQTGVVPFVGLCDILAGTPQLGWKYLLLWNPDACKCLCAGMDLVVFTLRTRSSPCACCYRDS